MNYPVASTTSALTFLFVLLLPAQTTKVKEAPTNFINSKLSSFRPQPLRLCRQRDVCRTSLKYRDGTVADEGLLCKCSKEDNADNEGGSVMCPSDWTEMDGRTLTWQHYERAHWFVQYRFCSDVFNLDHQCDDTELAAQVETDIKSWHPHVSQPRCSCPEGGSYKLMGWRRESGMWQYIYHCKKLECPHPSDPSVEKSTCAKIYIDQYRENDMVNEMVFLCNCPKDYMCDAKFDEKEDVKNIYSDDIGKYVIKECEKIVQKTTS